MSDRDAHRRGWDGQPELYTLYDATDQQTADVYHRCSFGPTIRLEGYGATPCMPSGALHPRPPHALFNLAYNIVDPPHPSAVAILEVLRQPALLGIALLVETWGNDTMTPEEREADPRSLADIPGSVERRILLAALPGGVFRLATRTRGMKPRVDDDLTDLQGPIVDALRIILAVIHGEPTEGMSLTVPYGMTCPGGDHD
jgi:hypothetical protein